MVVTSINGKGVTGKDVLELTVKDGKPEAKLNGQSIPVTSVKCDVINAAVCLINGEMLDKGMAVPAKGGIGLQAETGKFEFRRIRVKEMP
jgi:hypothetical protein